MSMKIFDYSDPHHNGTLDENYFTSAQKYGNIS